MQCRIQFCSCPWHLMCWVWAATPISLWSQVEIPVLVIIVGYTSLFWLKRDWFPKLQLTTPYNQGSEYPPRLTVSRQSFMGRESGSYLVALGSIKAPHVMLQMSTVDREASWSPKIPMSPAGHLCRIAGNQVKDCQFSTGWWCDGTGNRLWLQLLCLYLLLQWWFCCPTTFLGNLDGLVGAVCGSILLSQNLVVKIWHGQSYM